MADIAKTHVRVKVNCVVHSMGIRMIQVKQKICSKGSRHQTSFLPHLLLFFFLVTESKSITRYTDPSWPTVDISELWHRNSNPTIGIPVETPSFHTVQIPLSYSQVRRQSDSDDIYAPVEETYPPTRASLNRARTYMAPPPKLDISKEDENEEQTFHTNFQTYDKMYDFNYFDQEKYRTENLWDIYEDFAKTHLHKENRVRDWLRKIRLRSSRKWNKLIGRDPWKYDTYIPRKPTQARFIPK